MSPVIPLLALLLAATASAQNPSTTGFISIDCGLDGLSSYTDNENGLVYSEDEPYTSAGVNKNVSSDTNLTSIRAFYANVRSFPDGIRNCYTLRPVLPGAKYRVKAEFLYGNYDGLRRPPTFDLYLGVNRWQTVETRKYRRLEIITIAAADTIQVCLVNTGSGTPFISELDLRPLPFSVYNALNDSSHSIIFEWDRINYGALSQIGYPDDPYDRTWFVSSLARRINTTARIIPADNSAYAVPESVLQTAATPATLSENISIALPGNADQLAFAYMHFAELEQLGDKESREFDIYEGGQLKSGPYRPAMRKHGWISITHAKGGSTFFLRAAANSTLPPIINAVEYFILLELASLPTKEGDVKAMNVLKNTYRVSKNWEGDPCLPRNFTWKGLECGLNASNYSVITSLDLSRSGLSGMIPPSIEDLTSLTSLDLSYNNFTGEMPFYLGELATLKFLNLEGNNLSGSIPKTIYERSKNGSLELRVKSNPILCSAVDLCSRVRETAPAKKKNIVVPIAIAISGSGVLIFAIIITACILKRRVDEFRRRSQAEPSTTRQHENRNRKLVAPEARRHFESKQFSWSDITNITGNFERQIGKGGFGVVYYGRLQEGSEVAVKVISQSSADGEKQFNTEAQLLTRVHHKYLVSLLGYCKDNMALVYEFVSQGSLADHLSDDAVGERIATWSMRLRIALEAAQGLDYLHHSCKPPIVHRDVKPSNILLTENYEVKLADFGLSRTFSDEQVTHILTTVAGTPGYLDPEYRRTGRLNEKSDVYGFGVVLLQLITGKRPISNDEKRTHISLDVQSRLERGNLVDIADPKMQGCYDVNSMWKAIEIALSCASFRSSDRPKISDVAAQLRQCLADESAKEFPSNIISGTFQTYLQSSMANIGPSSR